MTTAISTKFFRTRMQWSQRDLAAELGVDQATVSRIESGAEPSRPVRRLLEALIARSVNRPGRSGMTSIITHDGTVLVFDPDIGVVSATSREVAAGRNAARPQDGLPKGRRHEPALA